MKHSLTLALITLCGFALSSHAQTDTVIVNDTWADGNRTSSGPDGGGIDTPWFSSVATNLTVPAAGTMRAAVPVGSLSETTYFASQTLANTGDQLMFTWTFTPTTITQNSSLGFNLAVVNGATHLSADGSPANQVYAGYSMYMNMSSPNLGNGNPFALREWAVAGGANNLLSTSAAWGANGVASATLANGGTSGNAGFTSGISYTLVMTLTRNASSGLDIVSTMTGGTINGTGTVTSSVTDSTPNTFTYDTFALRQSGTASGAAQVDTSLFKVDFITTSVPEPTTFALVGLGMLGLAGYRRMRR